MNKLIVTAFIASSLITGPGMLVSSTGALAQASCDSGAPAAWFRPGGYCSSIGAGKSLVVPVDPTCTEYDYQFPEVIGTSAAEPRVDARLQVAETCVVDCGILEFELTSVKLNIGDRVRVAQSCPNPG